MGFRAGLTPPHPLRAQLRHQRALGGRLARGYSLGSRRSGSRARIWCSPRGVRCLPRGRTPPGRAGAAGESGACARTASRDPPWRPALGWRSPLSPTPRGAGPAVARPPARSCPAPPREIGPVARGRRVQSFSVRGRERTWGFVPSALGWRRGSCGTETVYLLPDRVIYTGTHSPSGCRDDPSPGEEFCRCTQNVSPGPPGLGCGAAAGSVSRGVARLLHWTSGAPPPPPSLPL